MCTVFFHPLVQAPPLQAVQCNNPCKYQQFQFLILNLRMKLKEKVSNLETSLASMGQSSLVIANIESETEQLISCSCISDGPNTIEHLNSFSISAILSTIKAKAPNLLQLFETLRNTSRNLSESHLGLAVEQLKALVSICPLLGLQLLISIMLVARTTNKQVRIIW